MKAECGLIGEKTNRVLISVCQFQNYQLIYTCRRTHTLRATCGAYTSELPKQIKIKKM